MRDALILGLAVGVFGAGFGVLAVTSGLSVVQACAMSILVFTGASQFAAVGVVGAGGSPLTAIGSALLLGARNSFYGMTMAQHLSGSSLRRLLAAHVTIDESTALAISQDDPDDVEPALWAGGLSIFLFWNIGTAIGAIGGGALGDPKTLGLDAAFPAGFIALMMPALRHRPGLTSALAGAAIAIVTVPFTRVGVPIILSAFGAFLAFRVAGPLPVDAQSDDNQPDGDQPDGDQPSDQAAGP